MMHVREEELMLESSLVEWVCSVGRLEYGFGLNGCEELCLVWYRVRLRCVGGFVWMKCSFMENGGLIVYLFIGSFVYVPVYVYLYVHETVRLAFPF